MAEPASLILAKKLTCLLCPHSHYIDKILSLDLLLY